jgi:hypothetical protein
VISLELWPNHRELRSHEQSWGHDCAFVVVEPAKFGDLSTNCNKENYNRNVTCHIKMISRIHSIQINLIVGKFLTDVISGTCVFPVCIFLLGRCKGKHTTHIHTLSIWIDVHPSLWNVFDAVPSVISHSRFMRQGLTWTAWRGKVTWWVNKYIYIYNTCIYI